MALRMVFFQKMPISKRKRRKGFPINEGQCFKFWSEREEVSPPYNGIGLLVHRFLGEMSCKK